MSAKSVLERVMLFGLYAIPACVTWTVAGAHIAVGLAALAALAMGVRYGVWSWRRTPADAGAVLFALACVAATLTSQDRGASFIGLKKLLLLIVIPIAGAGLATRFRARTAMRLLVIAFAVTSAIAVVQFQVRSHAGDARLRGTGHYMTFAGLLLLAWCPAAAAAFASRGRTRWLHGAAALALGAGLILTFTRSAWIGMVLATGMMLLRARPRLLLAVPVLLALGLALAPARYRERAFSSFDLRHPNNVDRLRLWQAGIDIWRDHPWTGVGLVDLKSTYRAYRRSSEGQLHGHLHDNGLHILATTGSLGLAGFTLLMVGFGRIAWGAARNDPDREMSGLGHGVWGSFWGFQAMGLFEWNFGDVEVTIALYFLLGVAVAMALASRTPGAAEVGTLPPGVASKGRGESRGESEVQE